MAIASKSSLPWMLLLLSVLSTWSIETIQGKKNKKNKWIWATQQQQKMNIVVER